MRKFGIGMIRRVKEKVPQRIKVIEKQLEETRSDLKSIAKYGINGMGGEESRRQIADRIIKLKTMLLESGAYERVLDDE